MAYEFIEVGESGGALIITLSDPPTRNAIGDEMAREVRAELKRLEADPDLRALVITGRDPSFCSGANVKRMGSAVPDPDTAPAIPTDVSPWDCLDRRWSEAADGDGRVRHEIEAVRQVPLALYNLQKPSIAVVNGHAMGLGVGIALSCDIRIASNKARFSETFIRRGLIPADGSCWQLPRMIGLGNTFLLQYTGDVVGAQEALRLGLVNKVVPHGDLTEVALDLGQRLAQGPTYTMGLIKRLVQASLDTDFEQGLRLAGPA